MAAPIWEEEVPASPSYSGQEHDDDDVPLSFSNFMSGNGRNHAASGVRRSHTVTATGSRLHRISSGNSGSLSSSSSSAAATSNDRPLSASTGVSRRTSIKATSPSLNRVVEGSTSEEEAQAAQEQYPSNAYLPFDADVDEDYDNQALYGSATASLARHSSMPVSRAFRREASNPGAPWQRTQYRQEQQQPISPPLASASSYNTAAAGQNEQRIRSNSTAAEARFSAVLLGQGSTAASSSTSSYQAMSPNSPTFPVNSGFVVTSRPNSQILGGHPASQQRSAAGYNQQHYVSPTMSAAPGHGRSLSSHGWSHAAETTSATHRHHSPTHSRNASDSLSGSSSSHNQSLLGRVPSNASTSSNHARPTTGSTNSNHNSTPSPASPIDTSLLGQNNPWSPTAEERLHFRELSSTLNLASLRQPDPSSSNGLTDGIIESSISPGPISPPSSKRSSGLKGNNTSSPRRAHSLNLHGKGFRPKPIEEPVPQVSPASALPPSSIRQPQRKNTPVLPPLVTSSEALVNAAFGGSDNYATELSNRSNDQQTSQAQLANSINPTGGASFVQNGTDRQEAGANGKIIRGPASAAPYVPPIGHTHLSDKSGTSYGIPTVPIGPPLPHHEQSGRTADQVHGAAPSLGLSHVNHMRGFNTAGPGLPENIYLQERARIAGSSAMQHGQQYDIPSSSQYRNQQQQQDQHQQAISQYPQNSQATSIAVPLSPNGATNLNSAVAMHFPSLHSINDAANAAAFTTNLHLQQQLLVQQTQQLHEQQNQLANALANGLILQDQRIMHEDADLHQSGQMPGATPSLPTTPSGLPVQQKTLGNFQQQHDPYTISAKIEALQRANAMLVAAMSDPNAHHPTQLVQQVHDLSHQPPRAQPFQQFGNGLPNGPHGAYIQPFRQYTPGQSVDLGRPTSAVNGQGQQHLASVSPVDIHALTALKGYNPQNFDVRPTQARFFVIKSFTEDDVFKSIKFEIWSSTVLGNNRLDKAFSESSEKGPIYLFFSVNASGHFCGVAEMLTPLDYSVTSNVWAQGDKWKGVMSLRWIYIKDIPNPALRHLKLMNTNEQKPVTSSRDTQEVPYEQGCEMLRIFSTYQSKTSLLQDFAYYQAQTAVSSPAAPTKASTDTRPHQKSLGTPLQPSPAVFTQASHPGPYQGHAGHATNAYSAGQLSLPMQKSFSHKQAHPLRGRHPEPHNT